MNKETVVQIEVKHLVPMSGNRTDLGDGSLKELAADIKGRGIVIPLIVRGVGKQFEIVAGHRRHAAAKLAGLKDVPCIVRALEDADARQLQIVENLHRKNLNAIEEAMAFHQLRLGNVHTPQTIADLVNKDVKYVYRSLELLKLPAPVIAALEKGILTAAHGHQLARVGPKQIETAVRYALTKDWHQQVPSVEDLKQWIGSHASKGLADAPWDKTIEFAGKVACKGCPYNSENQDILFDQAEEGQCTNGACYTTKLHQVYKDLQSSGEQRWIGLPFIGMGTGGWDEQVQVIKGYQVVDEKTPAVKKAIQAQAEQESGKRLYGFGILKPSTYSKQKKPKLVVLQKVSEKQAKASRYNAPTPEEQLHESTVRTYVEECVCLALLSSGLLNVEVQRDIVRAYLGQRWTARRCRSWFHAAGFIELENAEACQRFAKTIPEVTLSRLVFWIMSVETLSEIDALVAVHSKIDLQTLRKEAKKRGEEYWKVNRDALLENQKKTAEARP